MFCTHCGTKIDEGKKFCRNCGASTSREPEPIPASPPVESEPPPTPMEAPVRSMPTQVYDPVTRPLPQPPPAGHGANKAIVIAAGIAIIVVGLGAGIYFGTDLLREPVKQESVAVQQPPPITAETPAPPSIEESKAITEATDSNANSIFQSPPAEVPPPPPTEAYKPQPEPTPRVSSDTYAQKAPAPAAVQKPVAPAPARPLPGPAIASRSPADPGTYETIRPTIVFEGPSPSARVVANIGAGIRVNVVGSNGDWLEVRSKHGKPPGFIRRDDAVLVARTN